MQSEASPPNPDARGNFPNRTDGDTCLFSDLDIKQHLF